ncbi:hypothetical protein BDV19DRAFT_174115 [Aspergillus venezuelensis]
MCFTLILAMSIYLATLQLHLQSWVLFPVRMQLAAKSHLEASRVEVKLIPTYLIHFDCHQSPPHRDLERTMDLLLVTIMEFTYSPPTPIFVHEGVSHISARLHRDPARYPRAAIGRLADGEDKDFLIVRAEREGREGKFRTNSS